MKEMKSVQPVRDQDYFEQGSMEKVRDRKPSPGKKANKEMAVVTYIFMAIFMLLSI